MATVQNQYHGYKYSSLEEAVEANRQQTNERNRQHKDHYNEYHRQYQRKVREQKKKYEQISNSPSYPLIEHIITNPQLHQQFISYINIMNNPSLYQHFVNYLNTANQQQPAFQLVIEQNHT